MPCFLQSFSFLDDVKFLCSCVEKNQDTIQSSPYKDLLHDESWINANTAQNDKPTSWIPPQNWINSCIFAISPFADVLVLSTSERTFFLKSKLTRTEESGESQKFLVVADKLLPEENGEIVICLFCLPVFYQRKNRHSSPDFTSVIVGFSTGILRIYTEYGELLLSQHIFEGPVCRVHYETYNSLEYEGDLVLEDDSKVVVIEGFVLLQTLKACRNQLARSKAGQGEFTQPPPLLCKRWYFPEAKHFQSCTVVGPKTLSLFDHLLMETLHNGPSAYPQTSTRLLNSVITTGGDLFIGFHHITDTPGPQALSDVAVAFASKLKTILTPSIGSKLVTGLWNNTEEKAEVQNISGDAHTAVPLRFGFFDKSKLGNKIYISSDRSLAAVTDNHNRVIVIDINRGLCVRIFKGYRDAQVGWIQADEADESEITLDKKAQSVRKVLYLIIYSPKRGILEVWLAPKGHKVAAFNVSRMGKLFYPGSCVLGLNGIQQQQMRLISNKIGNLVPCCLLEPNGNFTAIVASFKDALQKPLDSHSQDSTLYEDLQKCIETHLNDFEEKYVEEIKTILCKMESFDILKKSINLLIVSYASKVHGKDIFINCIESLMGHLKSLDDINLNQRKVLFSCLKIMQFAETHKLIQKINYDSSKQTPDKISPDIQTLSAIFSLTERETADVISAVSLHSEIATNTSTKKKRVSFVEEFDSESLGFFLSQFKLFDQDILELTTDMQPLPQNFDEHKLDPTALGQLLFDVALMNNFQVDNLLSVLKSSGIFGIDLLKLLLSHWLNGSIFAQQWKHWINFHELLKFCFSRVVQDNSMDNKKNYQDSWKEEVMSILSETSNLEAAFISCCLIRALVCTQQSVDENAKGQTLGVEDELKTDIKEWESLTRETIEWKILGNRLEDLLILDCLLKSKNNVERTRETSSHLLRHSEPTYGASHPISVGEILQRGQGAVSEVVAEWAVYNNLPPEFFKYEPCIRTATNDELDTNELTYVSDGKKLAPVKSLLREVSKRFPRCCDPEAIMANTSWENIVSWNKKPDKIEQLQAAWKHLNAIQSSNLKNGVACMMWKSFILPRFEALAMLMEKVGKAPKDRLCKQELLMSSNHLETFLEVCYSFLEYFIEDKFGNAEAEESLTPLPPDDLWKEPAKLQLKTGRNRIYSGSKKPGLVVLASDMGPPCYSSVFYHFSLARALLLIVTFELKNSKPLSHFYDKEARGYFFGDICKEINLDSITPSNTVATQRTEFLKRVASAIVNKIPDVIPPSSKTSTIAPTPKGNNQSQDFHLEASKWINIVKKQAEAWEVHFDHVLRHYVCELYSWGHDGLAEEALSSITDTSYLASELLILAGQRMASIVLTSCDTTVKLADLSPRLSTWIRSLNTESLKIGNTSMESTKSLIGQVISLSEDESTAEYKLSLDLFEAVNNLM